MTNDDRIRAAADEVEIRALMDRYFYALDTRDWESFRACFAEDAEAVFHKGSGRETPFTGNRAITEGIRSRIDSYATTVHISANVRVDRDGHKDKAKISVHGVANVVLDGVVLVRGLRYVDEVERRDGRWVITRHVHVPLWQYEAAAVTPSVVHRNREQEKRERS